MAVSLRILSLPMSEQQYSCHGCGNCCRDFTVQLRETDLARLHSQGWAERLGEPVTVEFRGMTFLRQREDGGCIFLQPDGLCQIHAEFGFSNKPIACQLFPFSMTPAAGGAVMGLNFACQSVQENKGADLPTHIKELGRMARALPEIEPEPRPPMLTDKLRAEAREVTALVRHVDEWLAETTHDLATRLDGFAWVAGSLMSAKLDGVRNDRFQDLLDVLFGALPTELELLPVGPPTTRQRKMLRAAVFSRTEDPKIHAGARQGRWSTAWSQLRRNRRLAAGRGTAPQIGPEWPADVALPDVERVSGATPGSADAMAIDDLVTRFARATVLGGRAWGAGYYAWPIVRGLQAVLLNVAAVGWLARLHAAGAGRTQLTIEDVRAAVGRIDRTAGRARWLGSPAERLRLSYFHSDDGLRRLLKAYAMVDGSEDA